MDAGSNGGGGRVRSREDGIGDEPGWVRLRRRRFGYGKESEAGRDRGPAGGPAPETVVALGAADVVMAGSGDPGVSPIKAVDSRDPTLMSDA